MKVSDLPMATEWMLILARLNEEVEKLNSLVKKGYVVVEVRLADAPEGQRQSLLTKDGTDAMSFMTADAIIGLNEELVRALRSALHNDVSFVAERLEELGLQLDGELADLVARAKLNRKRE